jgi:hypothetical protein
MNLRIVLDSTSDANLTSMPHRREAVQAVLDAAKNPKAQQVKPEDFYDNSFIQKLEASGFINSLYAR